MDVETAKFEGWAIIEMMGHRKEIGFVTTEHFGAAALFRVDRPPIEERDYILEKPEYHSTDKGYRLYPAGTKLRRESVAPRTVLVGPSSVYALNPCTEAAALKAVELAVQRPLILLEVPETARLGPADDDMETDFEEAATLGPA